MAYLLDANVFIQAKNLHYGLDFCPAFWEWLIVHDALRDASPRARTVHPGAASMSQTTERIKAEHRARHLASPSPIPLSPLPARNEDTGVEHLGAVPQKPRSGGANA